MAANLWTTVRHETNAHRSPQIECDLSLNCPTFDASLPGCEETGSIWLEILNRKLGVFSPKKTRWEQPDESQNVKNRTNFKLTGKVCFWDPPLESDRSRTCHEL